VPNRRCLGVGEIEISTTTSPLDHAHAGSSLNHPGVSGDSIS
jgi:hypothetical protein